jgi:hypothetical protein
MKKLLLILGFTLVTLPLCFAQGVFISPQTAFKTVNGVTSPIANATITVCAASASGIPCSPALVNTIFKDAALTQPLSNPFTTDANGNYQFAAAPGIYTVTVTATGFAGYSYQSTLASGAGSIVFKTNGTINGSQSILNLKNGTNVTIVDDGSGGITIASSGGASFSTAGQGWFLGGQSYAPISDDNGENISCASTANKVCAVQLTLTSNWTISKLGAFTVTGTGSSGNAFTAAIYSADGNTKLVDAGTNAFAVNGSQIYDQVSITPVTLSAGTYLFAWAANLNSAGSVIAHVRMTWFGQMLNGISFGTGQSGTTHVGQAANTLSAGAMPATLGVITAITNSNPVNVPAVIFLP